MERSTYYRSRHAYFCLADNHYVFLDLRSDEYLCLGRAHSKAIAFLLNGGHDINDDLSYCRAHNSADSDPSIVVQALLDKELLVQNVAAGEPLAPVNVSPPLRSAIEGSGKRRRAIRLVDIWHFLAAVSAASWNLRWQSIERTVHTVKNRKSVRAPSIGGVDNAAISDLFAIFRTLRPYYPRPYLCLFDSLALVHFLARYDLFPDWVYGVKLEPFAAHCWVQSGTLVVNDTVDTVRKYTPIMSV